MLIAAGEEGLLVINAVLSCLLGKMQKLNASTHSDRDGGETKFDTTHAITSRLELRPTLDGWGLNLAHLGESADPKTAEKSDDNLLPVNNGILFAFQSEKACWAADVIPSGTPRRERALLCFLLNHFLMPPVRSVSPNLNPRDQPLQDLLQVRLLEVEATLKEVKFQERLRQATSVVSQLWRKRANAQLNTKQNILSRVATVFPLYGLLLRMMALQSTFDQIPFAVPLLKDHSPLWWEILILSDALSGLVLLLCFFWLLGVHRWTSISSVIRRKVKKVRGPCLALVVAASMYLTVKPVLADRR